MVLLLLGAVAAPGGVSAQEGGGTDPAGPTTSAPPAEAPDPTTTTTTVPPGSGSSEGPDDSEATTTTTSPRRTEDLVPPPIDLSSLEQLLTVRRAEAVRGARAAADLANTEALAAAGEATETLDALLAEVPAAEARVEAARTGERAAAAELERARGRTGDLAVESYTLALSGRGATQRSSAAVIEDLQQFEAFVATTEYSGAAWRALQTGVSRARSALDAAEGVTADALEHRTELEGRIGGARAVLDAAVRAAADVAATGEAAVAAAAAIGEDLAVEGLGPTILGETVLSAEDLAAFSARRSGAAASVDLLELARYFVLEGTAEGVRGDIAWAQSILETGNFGYRGSMVSTTDHNYAGIGACDSCSSGHRYPTPQMGARAQMQLLRTYADDNLTADRLANPPAGRAPERVSVRGCCDTWMELSGVWATGPGYGVKILTIYNEMLAFAAERQRGALALVAATEAGPPASP